MPHSYIGQNDYLVISGVRFLDELTKQNVFFYFVLLDFNMPPLVWVSKLDGRVSDVPGMCFFVAPTPAS